MTTSLSQEHFTRALFWIERGDPGRHWPHDIYPGSFAYDYGGVEGIGPDALDPTEANWNAYQYNPPGLAGAYEPFRAVDARPTVRPKPTWAEILVAHRDAGLSHEINRSRSGSMDALERAKIHRAEVTDRSPIKVGGSPIHVGAGLDHMVGLLVMAEQATTAGEAIPPIVLRDTDHAAVNKWTEREVRDVLVATSRRENAVESAHNTIIRRYHGMAAIRDDETKPLAERAKAARDATAFIEAYETHLAAALAAYDPDALPGDLSVLREVLIERLEAAATGRQRALKGALTQQAIDNWAHCVELDDALAEVAVECRRGVLNLHAAETVEAAKAAFATAKAAIAAVTSVNVPEWIVNDGAQTQDAAVTVASRSLHVKAVNPTDADVPAPMVFSRVEIRDQNGDDPGAAVTNRFVAGSDQKARELLVDFDATTEAPITVELIAENMCGSSRLVVTVEDKT